MKLQDTCIGLLIGPGFEELEFFVPMMRLQEEGAEVKIIGMEANVTYESKRQCAQITSYYSPDDLQAHELRGIIIPGGWAPDKLRRDEKILQFVRDVYREGGIVAMICHGGLVGISAGIVEGKKAVGSPGIKDDLVNAGAYWTDEPAFRDGNLVWGRVVKDLPNFCRVLVAALSE